MPIIIASEGNALIVLSNDLSSVLVSGSLQDSNYTTMPFYVDVDFDLLSFEPDVSDLKEHKITDYIEECVLRADIISNNSIILRLFCKNELDTQDDFIGFSIEESELFKISKDILKKHKEGYVFIGNRGFSP